MAYKQDYLEDTAYIKKCMKTKLLESDYANKTFVDKNVLGLQQYAPLSTDALQIDIATGKLNGKIEAIRTSDASTIKNYFIKSGVTVALKRQYIISNDHAYVDIDMVYPYPNSKLRNVYNTGWSGWKLICGKIPLWSGSATEGQSITVAFPKAYFNSLDIYFTIGERMNCPLVDGNEDIWGSLITSSGNELYAKSVHLQFVNSTTIKIVSCKEKIISTGEVSTKNIVKIVGRP